MILAVIPARGSSRGLPRKNLRVVGGLPLIAWTVRAALGAQRVDRTVVSTEDEEIARVARQFGAEVPFMRPPDLADDAMPTLPVIEHAVRELESAGDLVSAVVTLQPTSPLRGSDLIDEAVDLLASSGARSVVAVTPLGLAISVIGGVADGRVLLDHGAADVRRQAVPEAMRITGSIYVTSRALLAEGRLLDDRPAALVTRGAAALDIDDERGLRAARRALGAVRGR
jgi:CMP-N,N'-diacetyllegionaminic acid synthase